jgi:predicted  nucleic acid-binding Zn-ribbon protein
LIVCNTPPPARARAVVVANLLQAKSAVEQIEDAHKTACRRVAALEADLENSRRAAHEQEMQSQAEKEQHQAEKEQYQAEKEDLTRRLLRAGRQVKELEWQGRKRPSGTIIVIDD